VKKTGWLKRFFEKQCASKFVCNHSQMNLPAALQIHILGPFLGDANIAAFVAAHRSHAPCRLAYRPLWTQQRSHRSGKAAKRRMNKFAWDFMHTKWLPLPLEWANPRGAPDEVLRHELQEWSKYDKRIQACVSCKS
jgi:hypothetical protein